jgi:hypothetical protein
MYTTARDRVSLTMSSPLLSEAAKHSFIYHKICPLLGRELRVSILPFDNLCIVCALIGRCSEMTTIASVGMILRASFADWIVDMLTD